ncbi:MAG: zinc ribbon domain-containing protein [Candidatus Freyarchaeum deiterrae]
MSIIKDLCAYCGTQVPSGALYCPRCGEPIDPSSSYDEGNSSERALEEEAEETGQSYKFAPNPFVPDMSSIEITKVLYEGMIRGSVTGESTVRPIYNWLGKRYMDFRAVFFVMRLEESFERIPNEILVKTYDFGYFGVGDKIILQGKILKTILKQWGRTIYLIKADHFYNETLQIGDTIFGIRTQELYKGIIRGSVTKEQRIDIDNNRNLFQTYFFMKLVGDIGVAGLPDEILVRYCKAGYFRIGDKVILQGKIFKTILERWGKPMYVIEANHFYNESLQIGDGELLIH